MDNLEVLVNRHLSGQILFENNEYIYNYKTQDKRNFVSLIMPVREKSYIHYKLHPIFEMHLPEGYLLSVIKKHLAKIMKLDDFGLLKAMAPAVNARVTYSNTQKIENKITLNELIHPNNKNLFNELVTKFALDSALSGVQPKVLAKVEDKATLNCKEYIVKSWGDDYKELALNEYYCMKIVQGANIPVPDFFISDDERLFIMKRFDILNNGKCLGFEDMCVLLARQRDDKYEGTYEQIAKVIKTFVTAKYKKSALKVFFKMIVINNLIQNGDAHLKNFGLIYEDIDNINLAPAYDVVCTSVYIEHDIPALHLLGSKKWQNKQHLLRFGIESCELTVKEVNINFQQCVDSIMLVANKISVRIKKESDKDKLDVLTKLHCIFMGTAIQKKID